MARQIAPNIRTWIMAGYFRRKDPELAAAGYWGMGLAIALAFASLVLHEFGHALAAWAVGIPAVG
jgi:Zn-dependent protease